MINLNNILISLVMMCMLFTGCTLIHNSGDRALLNIHKNTVVDAETDVKIPLIP